MITRADITEIGKFNKTHGIMGEISAILDIDAENISDLQAIIVEEDGIFVPYFITAFRHKSKESILLTIDGINSENDAKHLVGKTIYALKTDIVESDEYDDEESAYNFIGYNVINSDDNSTLGTITDIDDSTDNYLFIVEDGNHNQILIPIADEFITDVNHTLQTISMSLPEGLLNI